MKTKTKNKKSYIQAEWEAGIYFGGILAITFLLAYACLFFNLSLIKNGYYCCPPLAENSSQNNVVIKTGKNSYGKNEKISFSVTNNSDEPVYAEPCEQLTNYEKKVGGKWLAVENSEPQKSRASAEFNKSKEKIVCDIDPPETEGRFRIAANIYYGCQKADEKFCRESKKFYSNEFEIKNVVRGCGE